jgi:FixJ family two-component response regulator
MTPLNASSTFSPELRMNTFAELGRDSCCHAECDAAPVVRIVDDDASVRGSLGMLIGSAGWQTESFSCATAFLASSPPLGPTCLVLDVSLPGISGLDLQQRLAAEGNDVPIVMISANSDVPTTVRAMKAGAIDFLTKPIQAETLLSALAHGIERSRAALQKAAGERVLRERHAALTRREREVMERVVVGRLNKQVAWELDISEITVKAHRGKMMQKMRARSLPDLVNMAARLCVAA